MHFSLVLGTESQSSLGVATLSHIMFLVAACVCVHVYATHGCTVYIVYTCVYVYMCVPEYVCTYMYVYMCAPVCMCVYVHEYVCTSIFTNLIL